MLDIEVGIFHCPYKIKDLIGFHFIGYSASADCEIHIIATARFLCHIKQPAKVGSSREPELGSGLSSAARGNRNPVPVLVT